MPQEFHVVQCYSCNVFQVDIIKKVPKWSCKMCGEKQSVRKVYSKGSAKECRLHVQELNEKRVTLQTQQVLDECDLENEAQREQLNINHEDNSKWLKFMQNSETNEGTTTCNKVENCQTISRNKSKSREIILKSDYTSDQLIFEREKCTEKREGLEINHLNYKKFKSGVSDKKNEVQVVQSKNMFESCDDQDIDSLLEI